MDVLTLNQSEINMEENDIITKKHCLRCGWSWTPRYPGRPATCPNCSAARWDESKGNNEPGRKRIKTPPHKLIREANGRFKRVAG